MRDTKLFILFNLHWTTLKGIIPDDEKDNIAIYRVSDNPKHNHYAILSGSDNLDAFIKERTRYSYEDRYGVMTKLIENQDQFEYLFGNKELATKLTKKYNNDLDLIHHYSFRIKKAPYKDKETGMLFIIFDFENDAKMFFEFLSQNEYKTITSTEPVNNYWIIEFVFKDFPNTFSINTHKRTENYNQLLWLVNGIVTDVCVGVRANTKPDEELTVKKIGVLPIKMVQAQN